jgi:tetratricopeptide (TPR) repeat protein
VSKTLKSSSLFGVLMASVSLGFVLSQGALADDRTLIGLAYDTATGSFLAGREALADMRTSDAAIYFSEAAAADWENPNIIERSFMAYAADGQIAEAATAARHLLDLGVSNDFATLVIGVEALKSRRYGAAEAAFSKMGGDSFAGLSGGILHAWALLGDDHYAEAQTSLDALGQGGLADFLVFHRALLADVAGKVDEAKDFATRGLASDPYVARVVEAYARIFGNAGQFEPALKAIAAFEDAGLDHPLVTTVKTALTEKRRPGVFAPTVQAGAAEALHSVGVAMAREGSIDTAAVFLQMAMYLDPDSDVIDLVYGQLLDSVFQHEAANRLYERVADGSPMKPMAVVRVAENLDHLGDRPTALKQLAQIVAANPTDSDALSSLGDMLRMDKQYAEAAKAYSRILDLAPGDRPGDWRFYYVRGISYERNKEWAKAEPDFKRALELNPDQPQVLNYLGYSWVDQGLNLRPALDMIQKAVDASPSDGYIVDSLGWAYYRLGQFADAVKYLEEAVQMRPADPEINDHLGDAYWKAGRQLEARFQWNIAAAVDADGLVKARATRKLAEGLTDDNATDAAPGAETGTEADGAATN